MAATHADGANIDLTPPTTVEEEEKKCIAPATPSVATERYLMNHSYRRRGRWREREADTAQKVVYSTVGQATTDDK